MAMRDTARARLYDAFIEGDSAVAGGAPVLRVQIVGGDSPPLTQAARMPTTLADRVGQGLIEHDSSVAGGAPAMRARVI